MSTFVKCGYDYTSTRSQFINVDLIETLIVDGDENHPLVDIKMQSGKNHCVSGDSAKKFLETVLGGWE